MIPEKYKNLFVGPNKYTIGLIYMFANLMGFFTHMKKNNVDGVSGVFILLGLAILALYLS
mgnify:CR=1 FL=1